MDTPTTELMPLMSRAADLRATGKSWVRVAEELQRSAETCRHWPRRFPDLWRRLYREAESHLVAEAGVEARTSLRALLRDKDPRVILKAAEILERARERQMDREDRLERPDPSAESGDQGALNACLQTMTDEQLRQLLDDYLVTRPKPPNPEGAEGLRPAAGV